jgi:hypothetical protein
MMASSPRHEVHFSNQIYEGSEDQDTDSSHSLGDRQDNV